MKRRCDHTIQVVDERGEWIGSWVEVERGGRVKVVCECCGKFYGYVKDKGGHDRKRTVRPRNTV